MTWRKNSRLSHEIRIPRWSAASTKWAQGGGFQTARAKHIVVTGDEYGTLLLVPYADNREARFRLARAPGGVRLIFGMVKAAIGDKADISCISATAYNSHQNTNNFECPHAIVELERGTAPLRNNATRRVWRIREVRERMLWSLSAPAGDKRLLRAGDLLVIYDRGDRCRQPVTEALRSFNLHGPGPQVIVQCRHPFMPMSQALIKSIGKHVPRHRLVILVHANSLREVSRDSQSHSVEISTLSCERAALDLLLESKRQPLKAVVDGSHFLVALGAHALAYQSPKGDMRLVYAPDRIYQPFEHHHDPVGCTAILTASVVEWVANNGSVDGVDNWLSPALRRCAFYEEEGFGEVIPNSALEKELEKGNGQKAADLWCKAIFSSTEKDRKVSQIDCLESPRETNWSILQARVRERDLKRRDGAEFELLREIAINGINLADDRIPVARFGAWTGVDRHEIEGYQSLRNLMRKYINEAGAARARKPISLAAFGPPGSGKSFGVREIAKSLGAFRGKANIAKKPLTFNMAEFGSVVDLARSLHQSRDLSLTGEIPLVMFDEFDCMFEGRSFGWLKYFLGPMQDAQFRDGGSVYHVGASIFVFIGGVNRTFEELAGQLRSRDFVEAKGPDFISRLRGHVNVRGPNRMGDRDDLFRVRRAVLLHEMLDQRNLTKNVNIDVLRALLHVPEYRHGVRSMEAIIDMSDFSQPREHFTKSSLPPADQLDMHVDAIEFMNIVRGNSKG